MSGDKGNKKLAGILFTAAMAACCIMLYFFGGGKPAEDASQPEAQQPEVRAYPTLEVFFDRAEEYGFNAARTEAQGYAPAVAYSLEREELDAAVLVLSMKNGGVCAFTLNVPRPSEPKALPNDPTAVELSLYEQRLANWELEHEWTERSFGALLNAADIMRALTYADQSGMCALIWQTAEDGKPRDMKASGFTFSVNAVHGDGNGTLSISVVANE